MGGIKLLFRDLCVHVSGTGVRVNLIEPAEAADADDPAHTAALAFSVAENTYVRLRDPHGRRALSAEIRRGSMNYDLKTA